MQIAKTPIEKQQHPKKLKIQVFTFDEKRTDLKMKFTEIAGDARLQKKELKEYLTAIY